jgi:surface polysaccharide O-acyltransferase-like enzyme
MLAYTEGAVLKLFFHASGRQLGAHEYVGGILMVTGIFLLALAHPAWGQRTSLPYIGRFSLGIYLSHMLILYALAPIHSNLPRWPALWHVGYGLTVFGLSLLFTIVVSHIPVLRWSVVRMRMGNPRVSSALVSEARPNGDPTRANLGLRSK